MAILSQCFVVQGRSHPHECQQSKSETRSDVSHFLRRARSDAKVSPNDIEVRANDTEMSHYDAKVSQTVAKRREATDRRMVIDPLALDANRDLRSRYRILSR